MTDFLELLPEDHRTVLRRLRQEYIDLMRTGRTEMAARVLRDHDDYAEEHTAKCPNCHMRVTKANPGHDDGCVIGAMLRVAEERGHNLSGDDIEQISVDRLFEQYVDGAVTEMLSYMGVPPWPDED